LENLRHGMTNLLRSKSVLVPEKASIESAPGIRIPASSATEACTENSCSSERSRDNADFRHGNIFQTSGF
jgi:hypothetical protein